MKRDRTPGREESAAAALNHNQPKISRGMKVAWYSGGEDILRTAAFLHTAASALAALSRRKRRAILKKNRARHRARLSQTRNS